MVLLRRAGHRVQAVAFGLLLSATSAATQLSNLGLPDNGLKKGSIHIGFLPDWSSDNAPEKVNNALGGAISVIGDYVNVSPTDYSMSQATYHMSELKHVNSRYGVNAVYAPAVIFQSGSLSAWTSEMTSGVASMAKTLNDNGINVWIRFLFEMNGYWMSYGLEPELYVQVWREVTTAVRAATNNTLMLWSPNVWSGDVSSDQGYVPYWPGEEYVDIAGLSFYSFGYNQSENQPASSSLFRSEFTDFYNLLNPTNLNSSSSNLLNLTSPLPVVISETSAPYYYAINSSSPYYTQASDTDVSSPPNTTTLTPSNTSPPAAHSDDELYMKATWFVQLTSNTTAALFPNLKAVSWFNYFKTGGTGILADYRATGGNGTVEAWFRADIGNQTAYDLGYSAGNSIRVPWMVLCVVIVAPFLLL